MRAAIEANDLPRLLAWPEDYAETALADSYWQTLCASSASASASRCRPGSCPTK